MGAAGLGWDWTPNQKAESKVNLLDMTLGEVKTARFVLHLSLAEASLAEFPEAVEADPRPAGLAALFIESLWKVSMSPYSP